MAVIANPPPKKLNAGEIASALRRRILSAHYMQNERLPSERALSEEFGVARGTLREALKQLEESGYVERRAGSGSYVVYSENSYTRSVAETTSPLELIDARFALEPQVVRLAVLHATERNIAKLEERLRAVEEAGANGMAFSQADEAFHIALAECTQNSLLIWMANRVNEVRNYAQWKKMRELTLSPQMIAMYNAQHRAILEAIRTRNAEGAATAMKDHLTTARQSLVEAAAP